MSEDQIKLYVAVLIALVIRILSTPYEGLKKSAILAVTSVGITFIFTIPVSEILGVADEVNMVILVATLMTMTATGLVKWLLAFVNNLPTDLVEIARIIREWRSGK